MAVLSGCGGEHFPPAAQVPPGWADSLLAFRERSDAFFRSGESPLSEAGRAAFSGLRHYPPEAGYRFAVVPDRSGAGETVPLLDTKGELRRYRVHSRLRLEKDGKRFTLTVYESVAERSLFLAFRDATSGEETYGVGRYLDLSAGERDTVIVDFNYAKNPYCAYDERWACPLVPDENRIPIPIRAGEKTYATHGK